MQNSYYSDFAILFLKVYYLVAYDINNLYDPLTSIEQKLMHKINHIKETNDSLLSEINILLKKVLQNSYYSDFAILFLKVCYSYQSMEIGFPYIFCHTEIDDDKIYCSEHSHML